MSNKELEMIIKFIIDNYLYEIMYDDIEVPNISFYFKEKEAVEVINKIILDNIEFKFREKNKIYDGINIINYDNPVIEVSNYKLFFESINKLVYSLYNIYKNKCFVEDDKTILSFQSLLKYIWLRMTPDDFKNPENFLIKNINMLNNEIFDEYYNNDGLLLDIDDYYSINYANRLSSTFDEENKEILFYFNSKYNEKNYLPVLRYGIYKKDNKNVCEIGSIQNKYHVDNIDLDIVNDYRKSLNKNVNNYLKSNIEPKKLLSLMLFIKLLQTYNIYDIYIPSMYVLDYDFHLIWEKNKNDLFYSVWSDYKKRLYPKEYKEELDNHLKNIDKVDLISRNKTTDFIKLFERLMYHIPSIEIVEYPNEVSNYMKINTSNCKISDEYIRKLKRS